jgi:hypothetical protein
MVIVQRSDGSAQPVTRPAPAVASGMAQPPRNWDGL